MRCFHARKIPPGSHIRQFWLLSKEEQAEKVKKLCASGVSRGNISALTGLKLHEIAAIMERST
jgi:hypothetical protein